MFKPQVLLVVEAVAHTIALQSKILDTLLYEGIEICDSDRERIKEIVAVLETVDNAFYPLLERAEL